MVARGIAGMGRGCCVGDAGCLMNVKTWTGTALRACQSPGGAGDGWWMTEGQNGDRPAGPVPGRWSFLLVALAAAFAGGGRGGGAAGGLSAFAALAADFSHVVAVAADCFAPFLAGAAGFFGVELVGRAFLVGRLAALAGDFALLVLVHGSEAPFGRGARAAAAAALLGAAARRRALARATFFTRSHVNLLVCTQWKNRVVPA